MFCNSRNAAAGDRLVVACRFVAVGVAVATRHPRECRRPIRVRFVRNGIGIVAGAYDTVDFAAKGIAVVDTYRESRLDRPGYSVDAHGFRLRLRPSDRSDTYDIRRRTCRRYSVG